MWLQKYIFFCQCIIISFTVNHDYASANPVLGNNVREAAPNEFPFTVSMIRRSRRFNPEDDIVCAASLISARDVLTAEHCLESEQADGIIIIVGSNSLLSRNRHYPFWWIHYNQWVNVRRSSQTCFSVNDISIIRLLSEVSIDPLPLVELGFLSYEQLVNKDVTVVGWGQVNNGSHPIMLQTTTVSVISKENCAARVYEASQEIVEIDSNILCAVGNPFVLLMTGDSGGPVMYENKLVAINYGTSPFPEIYYHPLKVNLLLNIRYYCTFIDDVVHFFD